MLRFMLFLTMLLLLAAGVMAQDAPQFIQQGDGPVVKRGASDAWDGRFTDPGVVFYHDGQFHMFRNGFRTWPGYVGIAYLTSPDGIAWTESVSEPVLETDNVPYAEVAILAASALVEPDGTWVLYFSVVNKPETTPNGVISRATAADPLGPWAVDADPVLLPGAAGRWDDAAVGAPHIVKTEDSYVMYYEGNDQSGGYWSNQIGVATSADGVTWTKHDAPILSAVEGERIVHQPHVRLTADGWEMIYRSVVQPGDMRLGVAFSDDGLTWQRAADPIIWGRNTLRGTSGFWDTALAFHDDTYYLYIEAGRNSETNIFVATYTGSLKH